MAVPPTGTDLGAYLGRTDLTDADAVIATVLADQAARCAVDPYTDPLREAALRRGARLYAARAVPLGMVDAGDLGARTLARWDAEIEERERPFRVGTFA